MQKYICYEARCSGLTGSRDHVFLETVVEKKTIVKRLNLACAFIQILISFNRGRLVTFCIPVRGFPRV